MRLEAYLEREDFEIWTSAGGRFIVAKGDEPDRGSHTTLLAAYLAYIDGLDDE